MANYLRQTGAEVVTIRSHPGKVGLDPKDIDRLAKEGGAFSLAVLSPGPGNPTDFQVSLPCARDVCGRLQPDERQRLLPEKPLLAPAALVRVEHAAASGSVDPGDEGARCQWADMTWVISGAEEHQGPQ